MGEVGPKQKKNLARENQGEKIRAATYDVRKKVNKPQKKILAPPVQKKLKQLRKAITFKI